MPSGKGYWIATKSGAVQSFGQARTYPGKVPKGSVITAIASPLDGKGYWLLRAHRGAPASAPVCAFGGTSPQGSVSSKPLSAPLVGLAATPGGDGYWLVAANG